MKGTIEVLVGISGSGKSYYANQEWQKDPDNVTIVNRDKIRELLFGYTESCINEYYLLEKMGKYEKKVTRYEDTLINEALSHGNRVIVDATHLSRAYIERFKYWNVPTVIKTFDISLGGAIGRDAFRVRKVGDEVIRKQFIKLVGLIRNLSQDPIDFTPVVFDNNPLNENNIPKPPAVIFDIDGTLAHKGDRSPYDWLKVRQDTIDYPTCFIADLIYDGINTKTIICTGRDGVSLDETEKWLNDYDINYDGIYIRQKDDMRPDWVVKEEMWREIAKDNYIIGMFDDRLQVVRRARALGLKVFNVEYNNF